VLRAVHPQRVELNDEAHARPPDALAMPARVTLLAYVSDWSSREVELERVADLARRHGVEPPLAGAVHFSADLGPFRLKWERHTEFARYMVIRSGTAPEGFEDPAIDALPAGWLDGIPGRIITATHVVLARERERDADVERTAADLFAGNALVGASVGGGAARAFTDFRIHSDGFGRVWIADRSLTPRQAGRMVQRLLELDIYRLMAVLALPVARELGPFLTRCEDELAQITTLLANAADSDESELLDRLTRLAAEIESRGSRSDYRFRAASAYHDIVQRRIEELREERIQGLQTFREFTERRLAPALNTCRTTAARLDSLSARVARATQLLSTRVDLTCERQNQTLLASMDRRAQMQLRLQGTVEGLSVAAITYYVVGLVGAIARGIEVAGVPMLPDVVTAASVPFVLAVAAWGVRRIRSAVGLPRP
jgi:uncharacterized membrane-anchored protein